MNIIKKRECKNYSLTHELSIEPSYMNNVRKKILQYLSEKDLSVRSFVSKTEIGSGALLKFLNGGTKSLLLETAILISKELNCTLDDLVGTSIPMTTTHTTNDSVNYTCGYKHQLLRSVCNYVFFLIDELYNKKIDLSHITNDKIIYMIDEIYKFCYKRNLTLVNKDFAEMLLSKLLDVRND